MKLNQFDGGLHNRPAPQFLAVNEGQQYDNIDHTAGSLRPLKGSVATTIAADNHQYFFDRESAWLRSSNFRSYAELGQSLYWSNDGQPKKYRNGTTQNLGIPAPSTPTLSSTIFPLIDTYSVSVSETTQNPDGTYPGLNGQRMYYRWYIVDSTGRRSAHLEVTVDIPTNRTESASVWQPTTTPPSPDYGRWYVTRVTIGRKVDFAPPQGVDYSQYSVHLYRAYEGKFHRIKIFTAATQTFEDITQDISSMPADPDGAPLEALSGVVQYALTHYNSVDGTESAPSTATASLNMFGGGYNTLTLPAATDPQVTHVRLYRVGGQLSSFNLVKELPISTVTYLDDVSDAQVALDIGTSLLRTTDNSTPPANLQHLVTAYAIMFGAEDSRLRFTPINEPNNWPVLNFIEFGQAITGLAPVANGLLVFTKFKTFIVTGTTPTTLSRYELSADQGCIDARSIQVSGAEAWWASSDGICVSSGGRPAVITRPKLGKLELSATHSAMFDEMYYLRQSSGAILKIDANTFITATVNAESLVVANDKLYGKVGSVLHELFAGTSDLSFTFKSARIAEGSFTSRKSYNKVFVYSKGSVTIKILIDDEVLVTKQLNNEDNHKIQLPQTSQMGYYIQFEITGTGEVFEIEYAATPQEKR